MTLEDEDTWLWKSPSCYQVLANFPCDGCTR